MALLASVLAGLLLGGCAFGGSASKAADGGDTIAVDNRAPGSGPGASGVGAGTGATAAGVPLARSGESFEDWLAAFKTEARRAGISASTLDATMASVQPVPRVLELDQAQPEHTQSFARYVAGVVSQERIAEGRRQLQNHRAALDAVSRRTGVPTRVIVALWGVESNYGGNTGKFDTIAALATLAYDGRRAAFFRKELLDALRIVDEDGIPASRLRGSWAGAMGQNQFMPSTYRRYAVAFSGKGRGDIWTNADDVFATTANYLAKLGWQAQIPWGREVRLPAGFDASRAGEGKTQPLPDWARLGITRADGGPLPKSSIRAALIIPEGSEGRAFLAYDNYRVLMQWNRSTYFATSVGLLADAIGD